MREETIPYMTYCCIVVLMTQFRVGLEELRQICHDGFLVRLVDIHI